MSEKSNSITDIVVVGGGIVGASICYYLSKRGVDTILVDRDGIAVHASGKAFGGLHPSVQQAAGPIMQAFSSEAFEKHIELHDEINESGVETSTWKSRTSISLAFDEPQATELRQTTQRHSNTTKWLDKQALRNIEPRINDRAYGGLWSSNSAEVNSKALTKSLFRLSNTRNKKGEVRSPIFEGDRVIGVELTTGELIESAGVVFAMGPWSSSVLKWFELPRSVEPLKGQILRLRVPGKPLDHSFSIDGNYMSFKPDGLIWVGTTEEQVEFDDSTTSSGRTQILRQFAQLLPNLEGIEVVKQTACLRPMTTDGKLLLGSLPRYTQAFIATGGGRKGILFGPLMGQTIADQITDHSSSERWQTLAPSRLLTEARTEIANVL